MTAETPEPLLSEPDHWCDRSHLVTAAGRAAVPAVLMLVFSKPGFALAAWAIVVISLFEFWVVRRSWSPSRLVLATVSFSTIVTVAAFFQAI